MLGLLNLKNYGKKMNYKSNKKGRQKGSLLLCASANLSFAAEDFQEGLGQVDIGEVFGIGKEGGDFLGCVAGYAAAYGGDEEGVLLVITGEGDETLYGLTGAGEAFHGGDGVALALEAFAVTPLCSEMVQGKAGGTSGVVTEVVGAEDEDLAGLEGTDEFGGDSVGGVHKFQSNIGVQIYDVYGPIKTN